MTPASNSPEDQSAARRAELLQNFVFTDPLFAGRYPEAEREVWDDITDWSFRQDGDLEVIATPLDFVGVNTYFPTYAAAGEHREPDAAQRTATDIAVEDTPPASLSTTAIGMARGAGHVAARP